MKVMVVDDEPDVELLFRQKFRREIRENRLHFEFVSSGERALEYLETLGGADVVLILSDINMPGMTGLELLKKIKERLPQLRTFMITAYGDEENFRTAMAYGADDYLTKPIDFNALKSKMFDM
ncbi:MAG: response regulator [Acidobacteria bacterium]|nr:response regulator [Acidobacteriota bacterium]